MSIDNIYCITLDSSQGIDINHTLRFGLHTPIFFKDGLPSISLKSAVIPRSFYIINDNNDAFDIIIDATTYNITLPHGNYSAKNLTTVLPQYINASVGGTPNFTCSYSKITNKFTFTAVASSSVISLDANVSNSAYKLLGTPRASHLFSTSGANKVYVSDNCVNVMQINTAHIRIGNMIFSDVYDTSGNIGNIIYTIYFSAGFNAWENINESFIDWKTIASSNTALTYIDIKIEDEDGYYIDFNGVDWQMTLLLKITQRTDKKDIVYKSWNEGDFEVIQ